MFWNTTKIQTVYEWIFFYVKTTPYLRENNPAPMLSDGWNDGWIGSGHQPLLWLRSVLCVPSGHLLRDVSFGDLMYIFVQVLDGRLQKAIYNPFATIILVCCSTRRRSDARGRRVVHGG